MIESRQWKDQYNWFCFHECLNELFFPKGNGGGIPLPVLTGGSEKMIITRTLLKLVVVSTSFSSVLSCEDLLISSFHRSANM